MTDPAAVAAINAMAKKNVAATKPVAQTTYKPSELQDLRSGNFQSLFPGSSLIGAGDKSKANMLQFGASYMPSVNPTAQTTGAGTGTPWASGMPDWVRSNYENMGVDTSSIPLWGGGSYVSANSPRAAAGSGVPVGGFGGSSGGMGGLGSMMGGMGGMSGIGNALGSMLGGGGMGGSGGAGSGSSSTPPVDQRPEKPNPQRHYAGGYTTQELADQRNAGASVDEDRVKSIQDAKKYAYAQAHPSEENTKAKELESYKAQAQQSGGLYDTEGNFYTPEQADKLSKEESEKRKLLEAQQYKGGPTGDTGPSSGSSGGGSGSGSGGGLGGGGGGGFDFGSMLGGLSGLFGGMGGGGMGGLGSLGSMGSGGFGGFSMPSGFSSGALGSWGSPAASGGGKSASTAVSTKPKANTIAAGQGYGQSSPSAAAAINKMAAKNNAVAGSGYGMTNLGAAQAINKQNAATSGYGMNSPSAASNAINKLALSNANATKMANEGPLVRKTNLAGIASRSGLKGFYP